MAQKSQMFLIPFVLILGMLAGGMILLSIGTSSGIMTFRPIATEPAPASATPGTDRLNSFQCRKAETRQVLIGGVEDNYSTAELELTNVTPAQSELWRRSQPNTRRYDEAGLDNVLIETFPFDGEIARGLFVIRARSLTDYENDALSLSVYTKRANRDIWFQKILLNDIEDLSFVKNDGDLISIRLMDLKHMLHRDEIRPFSELVELYSQKSVFSVRIDDDHQVDFMGLAICMKPKTRKGSSFEINRLPVSSGLTSLFCGHDYQCDFYGGDMACAQELPLICMNPNYHPLPDNMIETYHSNWSGYRLGYSKPVRGNDFETADDAHDYCQREFGDDWRVMGMGDMTSDLSTYAYGDSEKTGRGWINIADQPYANCWDLRPGFED